MASFNSMSKQVVSYLCVVVVACILLESSPVQAQQPQDFRQVLSNGRKLESVQQLLASTTRSDEDRNRRFILGEFLREQKSDLCRDHFRGTTRVVDEYRLKAYNYVDDSRKSGNWFSNMMKFNNPLNAMKSLSRTDKHLSEITERYEAQWKNRLLTRTDVDCDLLKYKIRVLDSIMFVLRTDLKHLLLDSTDAANRAIYYQLKLNNLASSNNFYEVRNLDEAQKSLLLDFVKRHVNVEETNLGDLINRFDDLGNLVIGRLQDTCQTAIEFQATWVESELDRSRVCPSQTSDPQNEAFATNYRQDQYNELVEFCHNFLHPKLPIASFSNNRNVDL